MAGKNEVKVSNYFFPILEKYDMATVKIEDKGRQGSKNNAGIREKTGFQDY